MEEVEEFNSRFETHLLVIVLFAASLAIGDYGIRFYVYVLNVSVPHQIIAGVTEPITTKLLPALLVVYFHQRDDFKLNRTYLISHPYWLAFVGGLSLGLFERSLYLIQKDAVITAPFVTAPLMHCLNVVIVAGFLFSVNERNGFRFQLKLLALTVLAMAIHVFWNIWGVMIVYRAFH